MTNMNNFTNFLTEKQTLTDIEYIFMITEKRKNNTELLNRIINFIGESNNASNTASILPDFNAMARSLVSL